jgi:hypothetical protein
LTGYLNPREGSVNEQEKAVHHRLLALGFTHKESTYKIIAINSVFVLVILPMQVIGTFWLMIFNLLMATLLFILPAIIIQQRHLITEGDPHQQILLPVQMKKRLNHIHPPVTKETICQPDLSIIRKFHTILEKAYFW